MALRSARLKTLLGVRAFYTAHSQAQTTNGCTPGCASGGSIACACMREARSCSGLLPARCVLQRSPVRRSGLTSHERAALKSSCRGRRRNPLSAQRGAHPQHILLEPGAADREVEAAYQGASESVCPPFIFAQTEQSGSQVAAVSPASGAHPQLPVARSGPLAQSPPALPVVIEPPLMQTHLLAAVVRVLSPCAARERLRVSAVSDRLRLRGRPATSPSRPRRPHHTLCAPQ